MSLREIVFGRPLATEEDAGERVGPLAGVPILGLDALASASYGPEALLTVLLALGTLASVYLPALTALIVSLLVILYVSYRQTITAYPGGGGAYTVARENLGTTPSLFAAAALALDYVLNVAVAISAGVGALVSAVPLLLPYTLPLCLAVLALLTLVNLRGIRATGAAFMAPTYVFVGTLAIVIVIGAAKALASGGSPEPVVAPSPSPVLATTASLWLLMHAFAAGCTAMTGVEAVSNGVPMFREPAAVGARRTLAMIVGVLASLLVGIAFLCRVYGIGATAPGQPGFQSVISQVVAAVVGRGPVYFITIASVIAVLSLSANTSFAGFPRLCRILAGDNFLPGAFVHRGRRLVYSHGIIVLASIAAMLLIVFRGITDHLIPLFAVGAFLAFTMSQAGMVAHWRKRRGASARHALVINAVGALATAATLVVIIVSKITEGAWISVVLVAVMIVLFREIRRHYDFIAKVTAVPLGAAERLAPRAPIAVVPARRWDAVTLKALRLAMGLAPDVVVVQVLTGDRDLEDLRARWDELAVRAARERGMEPPRLVVVRSEYRRLLGPMLDLVTQLAAESPDRQVAVIIPELMEARWYQYLLHGHTASRMKALLLLRGGPQIVVVSVPWYLEEWRPERRRIFRFERAHERIGRRTSASG